MCDNSKAGNCNSLTDQTKNNERAMAELFTLRAELRRIEKLHQQKINAVAGEVLERYEPNVKLMVIKALRSRNIPVERDGLKDPNVEHLANGVIESLWRKISEPSALDEFNGRGGRYWGFLFSCVTRAVDNWVPHFINDDRPAVEGDLAASEDNDIGMKPVLKRMDKKPLSSLDPETSTFIQRAAMGSTATLEEMFPCNQETLEQLRDGLIRKQGKAGAKETWSQVKTQGKSDFEDCVRYLIAELLSQGHRLADIATILPVSKDFLRDRIQAVVQTLGLADRLRVSAEAIAAVEYYLLAARKDRDPASMSGRLSQKWEREVTETEFENLVREGLRFTVAVARAAEEGVDTIAKRLDLDEVKVMTAWFEVDLFLGVGGR